MRSSVESSAMAYRGVRQAQRIALAVAAAALVLVACSGEPAGPADVSIAGALKAAHGTDLVVHGSLIGGPDTATRLCQSVVRTGAAMVPHCEGASIVIRGVDNIPEAEPPDERGKPWFTPRIDVHGTVRDGVLHAAVPPGS